ncbi:MAG: response regulator transcription factor [Aggregatilineales bacterium]
MKRVLVVDDEPESLAFLIKSLEQPSFELKCFSTAPPALRYVLKHPIDVAVIDFQLPGPDGLALAKKIRYVHPQCTIVMVSQYAGPKDLERGYEVQINDFVRRPISNAALLNRVNEAIARSNKIHRNDPQELLDPATVLQFLDFDPAKRTILWHGERLKLTQLEVLLMTCLASDDRHFNYSDLCLRLYGEELSVAVASVKLRAPLNRLRKKLEADNHPRVIEATRRQGFRWNFENASEKPRYKVG